MARRRAAVPLRTGAPLWVAAFWTLAACDVPTSPPEWETTWVVPGDSIVMAVSSLLPSTVTVTEDESAFVFTLDGADFENSLGELCGACQTLDGVTAPKPAFSSSFGSTVDLPGDVVSATVVSGAIEVSLTNGFNFDPIRPSSMARGKVRVRLTNDGAILAADSLDGTLISFAPGTTRRLNLALAPGVVTGAVGVEILIDSPTGDPVSINAGQPLSVSAVPGPILISQTEIAITDKSVDIEPIELDLESVDDEMVRRIRGGAFRLALENPFSVVGALGLSLTTGTGSIDKGLELVPGASTQRVEFTGAELRDVVGHRVHLGATGTLTAPGGTITVTPSQVMIIDADLELVLGPQEG